MLTKKQLEDAASCSARDCRKCSVKQYKGICGSAHCTEAAAQTALAYREMLEKLEWVEVGEREVERKMIPAIVCPSCDSWKEEGHKTDCELAALLKEVEKSELK